MGYKIMSGKDANQTVTYMNGGAKSNKLWLGKADNTAKIQFSDKDSPTGGKLEITTQANVADTPMIMNIKTVGNGHTDKVLLRGIAEPQKNDDAVSKQYADAIAQGLQVKEAVAYATNHMYDSPTAGDPDKDNLDDAKCYGTDFFAEAYDKDSKKLVKKWDFTAATFKVNAQGVRVADSPAKATCTLTHEASGNHGFLKIDGRSLCGASDGSGNYDPSGGNPIAVGTRLLIKDGANNGKPINFPAS